MLDITFSGVKMENASYLLPISLKQLTIFKKLLETLMIDRLLAQIYETGSQDKFKVNILMLVKVQWKYIFTMWSYRTVS